MMSIPFAASARAEPIKVLAFDVFGTVVDWHGSICRKLAANYPQVPAAQFARAWRAGYVPAMARVMADIHAGGSTWVRLDALHLQILEDILPEFGLAHLSPGQRVDLNLIWHQLDPWPDVVEGLARLRKKFMVCSLSNGNLGLLADMAKHGQLPWDCILSAEVFRRYKPDPATYLGVADIFAVTPGAVMMVAAHHEDLAAARSCGLQSAYIERPMEFGMDQPKDVSPRVENHLHCQDLLDLATALGC